MDLKYCLLIGLVLNLGQNGKGQDCGYPGVPANGGIEPSEDSYNVGETVSYFCNGKSVLMGATYRQCQRNGTWSNEVPVCGTALHPLGSSVASQYEDNHGPELAVDGKKNTCARINPRRARWWRVSLEKIHLVQAIAITMANKSTEHKFTVYVVIRNDSTTGYSRCASFQGTFASQTVLLSCAEGKGLKGHIVHIEDNRQEEQSFNLCEVEVYVKKDMYKCGEPERKLLSVVVKRTPDIVKYRCSNGFILDGSEERRCLPTGRWSGEAPRCIDSSCVSPPPIPHGTANMFHAQDNGLSVGSYVFYTCHPGYMLLGNSTRMCKKNGKWSGESPICRPLLCQLPKIDDDDIAYKLLNDSTEYNSIARVYCKSNDTIRTNIQCLEKGIWTEPILNCTNPVFGTAIMRSSEQPELYFTEGILVALVFAGVVIVIVAISLIIWQRKDPTPMMEIDPPELKEDASSMPKPINHQAPDLEIPLTTSDIKAEEEVKSEEEATIRPSYSWSAYIRPNAKVRSLPLPPSRKSSAAGSKENIYEEIALWARRAASLGGTLEENKIPPQMGGTNTSRSINPELLALYAKVDFDKKRKSRQLKEQSVVDVTEEGPQDSNDDSQPFPLRELPPIPTEESSSSEEETSEEQPVRNSTSPEVQQQTSSQETEESRERKSSSETERVKVRKRNLETKSNVINNSNSERENFEEESSSSG